MRSLHVALLIFGAGTVTAQSGGSIAGKCTGQSCYIAKLSTSTNDAYKTEGGKKPTGGSSGGDKCIKEYYTKFGLPPPEGIRRFARGLGGANPGDYPQDSPQTIKEYLTLKKRELAGENVDGVEAAECQPNTLVFARATVEPGIIGSSVGPALKTALGSGWETVGVSYTNDLAGIKCIGMPGGYIAKGVLEGVTKRCPNTNLFVGGYSQGCMVARIGLAWANDQTKNQVKGLVLFGDPFNGATIKGIPQSKIKVLCNNSDGVCKGDLSIGAGHLSYTADGSVAQAVKFIKGQLGGGPNTP